MELTEQEKNVLSLLVDKLRRETGAGKILMYGSAARAKMDEESDIDLLLVLPEVTWELEKKISEMCFYAGLECDRVISTACFTAHELESSPLRCSPMVRNALRKGVSL